MTDFTNDHPDTSAKPETLRAEQTSDNRGTPALIEKFVIRLPKGLRKKIKHLSEQNRRSMNSEIIMVLEKHIQQHLADNASDFTAETLAEHGMDSHSMQTMSDSELTRRLESLPEEKKLALLELLG